MKQSMKIPATKDLSGYAQGLRTANMDHHGLVGSVCKDLKIAQRIDQKLGVNPMRKVSPGQGVVAMILNGLGYTNRTLYMSQHFFASKPIEHLIDPELKAEDITDYTLAHTLDDISKYGASKLFMELGMEIAIENNLLEQVNHLDTTSFSLEGEYETKQEDQVIRIRHGHSKDHRPDLKQVVLSLVVNGSSGIPICMEPLSGNSSDKVSFHETINKVEAFKKQINIEEPFKWVADSALYTKDKLLKTNVCIRPTAYWILY
jgi:transposase